MKSYFWMAALSVFGGLIWIGRAFIELVFKPNYWNPQSVIDYLAVFGTSLSLLLLAGTLWMLHTRHQPQGTIRKWLWLFGIMLSIGGGFVAGIANFGEDWFAIKALGTFFIFGSFGLFIGLLISGISAIGSADFSRWLGPLLIACAFGVGFQDQGGGFIVGFSLLILATCLVPPMFLNAS